VVSDQDKALYLEPCALNLEPFEIMDDFIPTSRLEGDRIVGKPWALRLFYCQKFSKNCYQGANMAYTRDAININPQKETEQIVQKLKNDIANVLKKRGAVVGVSGGLDSAVVLALCVKALGANRIYGVIMPEKESSEDSLPLAKKVCELFHVEYIVEKMTPSLEGFDAYHRRDEAIKKIFPEYDHSYKAKITLPEDLGKLNVFYLTIISPGGEQHTKRLPLQAYLKIMAASNFKQRSRMCMLYFYSESLNYAVVGTGNKNEQELGFFVKYGDGGVDLKPIVHLLKTQIYQLAEYLDIPQEIIKRTPTSDTYSAHQTQQEFFYKLPFDILDRIWYGWEKGFSAQDIADALNLEVNQVEITINDIERKKRTTDYLRLPPL